MVWEDEVRVGDPVRDAGLEVHVDFERRVCPGDDGERGSDAEDPRVV